MDTTSTGYGPRSCHKLHFDGNEERYELWEAKFISYLRIKKLHRVVEQDDGEDEDDNASHNALVYAELMQFLDEKCATLIFRDAKNDGKKAMKILREHYLGSSEPRIMSLYSELASLKMSNSESVTDYLLRAETSASRLTAVDETVSDRLLIAMILRGLPESFKAFCTVTTQKDKSELTLPKFKSSLRSYEENEKARADHGSNDDNISQFKSGKFVCYACGEAGHRRSQCTQGEKFEMNSVPRRWCVNCKSSTHDTDYCRKNRRNQVQSVNVYCDSSDDNPESSVSYNFCVSVDDVCVQNSDENGHYLLVDSGATSHIINDPGKFVRLDKNFNPEKHFVELADGSRRSDVVTAKGDAQVMIADSLGRNHRIILKGALCIPSYKQDILSVIATTENGNKIQFLPSCAVLETPDGNSFQIQKLGKLYYLNSVKMAITRPLEGHCNANISSRPAHQDAR